MAALGSEPRQMAEITLYVERDALISPQHQLPASLIKQEALPVAIRLVEATTYIHSLTPRTTP